MITYPQMSEISEAYLREKIEQFLLEDIPNGDKTTLGTIPDGTLTTGQIQAEETMVFAGEKVLPHCFPLPCQTSIEVRDGQRIRPGTVIGTVSGLARTILSRERVMLNLLQRLCGIATATSTYVDKAAPHGVKILDTRKTTPGLRILEKYAVAAGGGRNHRLDLSSGILIKDNHLKASGGVTKAIASIKSNDFKLPVELEVDTFEQIHEGLTAGVDGFLLDNMSPTQVRQAVELIRSHPGGEQIFIEASGGITFESMDGYLTTGIDAISIGALTHSVKGAKIRMEFLT